MVDKNEEQIEKTAKSLNGIFMILLLLVLETGIVIYGILSFNYILIAVFSSIWVLLLFGFKTLQPNSSYVLTLFGKYIGTLKGPGFFYVNPFSSKAIVGITKKTKVSQNGTNIEVDVPLHKLSLKAITHNNEKQKINDLNGNPIEIGFIVIWKVVDTAKAAFNVENFYEFLSIQSDSAIRTIVREYPYDCSDEEDKLSLRGDASIISDSLRDEIQKKVSFAGIEVLEAKITYLAYAREIAAAMLQRQQASAIIDARKQIVNGAVSMVQMALEQLKEAGVLELDEERKAAMVSNLLVVLVGNKDAQPIVNSGSLY